MKSSLPNILFLLMVLLITSAFFGLIGGFFYSIFWAIVFAILFQSKYETILARIPHKPNLASILTLLTIICMVVLPLVAISFAVYSESIEIIDKIQDSNTSIGDHVNKLQDKIPLNDDKLKTIGLTVNDVEQKLEQLKSKGSTLIAGKAVEFTQNIFGIVVSFFLMIYILFFFIRDGKRLVQELIWVLPINDKQEVTLLKRFEGVVRATVKGSLLVALVQGALGGLAFLILGIPGAFMWGVLMILASLLPTGSAIIWLPWSIVLMMQGHIGKGIALIVIGAGFIGLIDNFMRPALVGKDTKMPDYLILLSTLGGLSWFGLTGFVLGPIIAGLAVTCWKMLGEIYGKPYEQIVTAPTAEELSLIDDEEQ